MSTSERKKSGGFLSGFFILAFGGALSKIIGAAYRIPLMAVLGAEGMGVYQLIFPLYLLLLTVSSSALPIVVSRLVARSIELEGGVPKGFLKRIMLTYGGIGGLLSVVLAALSGVISGVQGNALASYGYVAIAPSVVCVAMISVLRGYFQGRQNMMPTGISQIIEQVVKVPLGLYLAYLFMPNIKIAVMGAAAAASLGEIAALLFLTLRFVFGRKNYVAHVYEKGELKSILKQSAAVTAGGIAMPLTQIIDSMLVINIISRYSPLATAMYGILSGTVYSLINLPVGAAGAAGTSLAPRISKNLAGGKSVGSGIALSVGAVLAFALPAAGIYFLMGNDIISILYPSFSSFEFSLATALLKGSAISIVILSVNQILVASLQAAGKMNVPAMHIGIACVIKLILSLILMSQPRIHIFGAVISANVCYLVASALNLVYIIKSGYFKPVPSVKFVMVVAGALFCCVLMYLCNDLMKLNYGRMTAFAVSGFFAAAFYALILYFIFLGRSTYDQYYRARRSRRGYLVAGIPGAQRRTEYFKNAKVLGRRNRQKKRV